MSFIHHETVTAIHASADGQAGVFDVVDDGLGPYVYERNVGMVPGRFEWVADAVVRAQKLADAFDYRFEVRNFSASLKTHQHAPMSHWGLMVTLTASDNPCIKYPARGLIVAFEQGTDMRISQAIFHHLEDDGSLGAPVRANRPQFTFGGDQ